MKNQQRTCIACRRTADKSGFLRFVLSPDKEVTPDLENKLPGRGAYTCIARKCLVDSVKRGQFSRSFKESIRPLDLDGFDVLLQKQMVARISGYISLAAKAGAVTSGGESVERGLRAESGTMLLLVATDISPSIAKKLEAQSAALSIPFRKVLDKEQFGCLIGKESDRSALLVKSAGFCKSILREIERYRNYLQEESGQ